MHYTVYKITNIINGKYYIGKHQTNNLNDGYMGSGKYLKRAIEKDGLGNFTKEILFVFDNEQDMNYKEKELVVIGENSYNLCEGGHGGFGYINSKGLNMSGWKKGLSTHIDKMNKDLEYREKYLNKMRTIWKSDEHRNKLSKANFNNQKKGLPGKPHSEETKLKLSLIKKGKYTGAQNSQFGTMWVTNGLINKKIKKNDEIPLNWKKGRV